MNIQNPEAIAESPELDGKDVVPAPYWTPERMATAEPLLFIKFLVVLLQFFRVTSRMPDQVSEQQ